MSPLPSAPGLFSVQPESETTGSVPHLLLSQWENPSDILSVLLILGPEIVQRAVAQLAGRGVTPVAFSFGWVAYATRALLNTFGDGRLMPEADMANTCVIGAASGHSRSTSAWILGRLLRDEDDRVDNEMCLEHAHVPPGATGHVPQLQPDEASRPAWEALRVTVYSVDENPPLPHGVPVLDSVWYSGIVVIVIQVTIAIIPWAVEGDWSPFLITATGNILALAGASLPQWSQEKWACPNPPRGGSTVAVTQGNGSRHAVIILGSKGVGLDLEILALGTRTARPSSFTRLASAILALLWIMLLVSVSGLDGGNSWYLLGIGLLGSIQNMHAAGASRRPSALGIHLIHKETIRGKRVASVLKEAEEKYPTVGTSLLPVFFPGSLRVKGDDLVFWRKAIAAKSAPNKFGSRVDDFPTDAEEEGQAKGQPGTLANRCTEVAPFVEKT